MPRFASVLLAAAFVLLAVAVPTGAAQAAPVGHVLIVPGDSIDRAAIRVRTSGGCPAKADAYFARVHGHGFPGEGQLVTPNTSAGLSHTAGFDVYFAQTMKDFADDNNTKLTGRYDVIVYCVDSFTLTSYGEFTGALRFSSPTRYTALGAARPVGTPPPPVGAGEPVPVQPGAAAEPPPAAAPTRQAAGVAPGERSEGIDLLPILLVAAGAFVLVVAVAALRRQQRRRSAAGVLVVLAAGALVAWPAARPAAAEDGQPQITIGVVIPSAGGPTTTPPSTSEPPTSAPPTTTNGPGPAPGGGPPPAAGGGLSYTGSPVGLIFAAGLALLATGIALVQAARRRRHSTT